MSTVRPIEKSSNLIFDLVIGFLIYGSTLFFASNALLILVLLILALRGSNFIWRSEYSFVVLFSFLAYANILFHLGDFDISRHFSSLAVPLVLLMVLLAPQISNRSLKVFIILTCFEIFIGAYEFKLGQVALFSSQVVAANQEMSYESLYLYDLRVYGLSSNSSILAEKIFLSILISYCLKYTFRHNWPIFLVLGLGLIITFNRTTILTSILFFFLAFFTDYIRIRRIFFSILILILIGVIVTINSDELLLQFARGSVGELSYSELSRLYFWEKAFEHLVSNPFLGNGSLTYRIYSPEVGTLQHAHNSLVMIFATHGLIIPIFLFTYILIRLPFVDYKILLVFIVYSMAQYFVFWNLSVPDLIFFWFLGRRVCKCRGSVRFHEPRKFNTLPLRT